MVQQILVLLIFCAAVVYAGRQAFRAFTVKDGCATGCGKCGAIDADAIEQKMRKRGI